MRRLVQICLIALVVAVLWSCEGNDRAKMTEVGAVKSHVPRTALELDTAKPASEPPKKPKRVKRPTLVQPKPADPDTAVSIVDYCDSITGGSAKTDTVRSIDIIVVHSSYYADADSFNINGIIDQYEEYGVSAHYLVGRDGTVYRLVPENDISYHAGKSILPAEPSRTGLNGNSIGIEVVSTETNPPTQEQYDVMVRLVNNVRERHDIRYIYRHSDIAPLRKTDPWGFDWETFLNRLNFQNPRHVGKVTKLEDVPAD